MIYRDAKAFPLLLVICLWLSNNVRGDEDKKVIRLLTIGNQLTESATELLDEIAASRGNRLIHKALTINDSTLQTHHKRALTPVDPIHGSGTNYANGETLGSALLSDTWDFVTIQLGDQISDAGSYLESAGEIADLVHRYAPQAELVLHQTWALRADDPKFSNREKQGVSAPATTKEMFLRISNGCATFAKQRNASLIPCGQGFYLAGNDPEYGYQFDPKFDVSSTKYPSLPPQKYSLHAGYRWINTNENPALILDSHRASTAGQYLAASIWHACLFDEDPSSIDYLPQGLDKAYANFLKTIAQSALRTTKRSLAGKSTLTLLEDSQPNRYTYRVRASEVDPQTKDYPEIGFTRGFSIKPNDWQYASVDTRVPSKGKLVLWLMGHNEELFKRLNRYGLHAIDVHYARGWFGKLCQPKPETGLSRGEVRLEAATGLDRSDELDLQVRDGASERARRLLIWLSEEHPTGNWHQFLTPNKDRIRWDKVIVSGASHGSTTAARFAKFQRVDRVVMLCGPRDQDQTWQGLYSATPSNRDFGVTHVLEGGWIGVHYCRSWQLLDLHQYGSVVDVDHSSPPYSGSRRLISSSDVGGDARRAHSAVTPGKASPTDGNGHLLYEPVWQYLYTQPVNQFGVPVPAETDCDMEQNR